MRFRRYALRFEERTVTSRRLAAAKRKLEKQANALPLFAEHIRAEQPTPEQVVAKADDNFRRFCAGMRAHEAQTWLRGRALLRALPKAQRLALLAEWDAAHMPATAVFFVDFLRTRGVK